MSYRIKSTGQVVDDYRRGTEPRRGVVVNPSGPRVVAAAERIVSQECSRHDLRANIADLLFGGDDDE